VKFVNIVRGAVVCGLLVFSAPGANAARAAAGGCDLGPGGGCEFSGGCGFDTVNQAIATGQSRVGEASVVIIADSLTSSISNVSCEFLINGVSQGTVLTAPDGTGVTANAGRFEFSASDTDTTTMCTHATINGVATTHCGDGEVTQIPPQAVLDAINTVIDLLNDAVFSQLDPTVCAALVALKPMVDALGHPEIIAIDGSGDTYLLDDLFWDCPPYVER
jgi:hypothetical protein